MPKWIALAVLSITGLFAEETNMKSAPYGSWSSPITGQMVASGTLQFSEVKLSNGKIYWLERRPLEGGRTTLMSWDANGEKELLPKGYNVRSRVHEYGGGALLVSGEEIYFINDKDQQVYHLFPNGKVEQVTNDKNARFADGCLNPLDSSLFYVMEKHSEKTENSIVRINSKGKIETVASGHDFYSNPRISPNGQFLAYLSWDHPNMPWDGTELWILDLKSKKQRLVAGSASESIGDPKWSSDGKLYYVSDRSNWWNVYQEADPNPLWATDGEFLLPQWMFGRSLIGFSSSGIISSYVKNGANYFATISFDKKATTLNLPYTAVKDLAAENEQMAMIASSAKEPSSIILYDIKKGNYDVIKCCRSEVFDEKYISKPVAVEFPTADNRTAFAFYYPPSNPKFCGMPNEKPPLIVNSHGGPTGHVSPCFAPNILFWTSRGFGVIDVNYGGSTGYGRPYRDRLKGKWGIVDIDDCTNAALHCVKEGLADPKRLAIEGASAGGYTTLAVLAFRDVFQVGADYFGVSDLERLALDTHKFESRYLDQLVGTYPEKKALYHERSPIYNVDKIHCPVIIFQGDEDAIVPPSQSEMMHKSLITRNIPTAYLLFKGEQHGFRKAEHIQRALEAQLYFFSKVLRFPLSEEIKPVSIENLPKDDLVLQ